MIGLGKCLVWSLVCVGVLVGCEKAEQPQGESKAGAPVKVQLALNWKAEPQFGGFYAAKGAFEAAGLDVTVLPGGSGTPTVQMVAAGQVEFAVVSADEVLINRARGGDVVALFAVYQTNPQGLMTHASRNLTDIGQIFEQPGRLALQAGLPYANFLKNKYGFGKLEVVPNTAGVPAFLRDETMSLQCFVTSEPLTAAKLGTKVRTFLVAESGYNPYTTVLVARGALVRENPALVSKVTLAVKAGWETYLKDPTATNAEMMKLNPAMDAETFAASAEAQRPLILVEGTSLGDMTLGRWEELGKQLVALGVLERAPVATECFVPLPK